MRSEWEKYYHHATERVYIYFRKCNGTMDKISLLNIIPFICIILMTMKHNHNCISDVNSASVADPEIYKEGFNYEY